MLLAIKSAVTGWFNKPAEPQNVIFGATLDKQLAVVPPILVTLQQYILRHGLETQGIFRVSGNQNEVKQLMARINRGEVLHEQDFKDALTAATLFKSYFRELQEPVLSYDLHGCWLALGELHELECAEKLPGVVALLAPGQRRILQFLLKTLHEFAQHAHATQMSLPNLAVVFAPSLLKMNPRDASYSPLAEMQQLPHALRVTQLLISEYPRLFAEPTDSAL
eukprot:TRINITY_DN10912_c0_g1_i1.p1 TRINITY_DN10912_c0_g1~~TRINITY_DN10912_c0_g1_i1.p1  ORF type:complete len:222 (+),score=89.16 TRINITY_DN10912_c0_g1_i1:100-765(+)